jgi:uncharacterized membrane protein
MNPTDPPQESPETIPELSQKSQERSVEARSAQLQRRTTRTRLKGGRIVGVIHEAVRQELRFFSGPLPPPEDLIQYNQVFPDCGKAIVEMAQKEQDHRHAIEDRQSIGDLTLAKRGQIFGGILALIAVCGAIYLLANGESASGLAVLGGVVASFGGAFVYDRYQKAHTHKESDADENQGRTTQELRAIEPPTQSDD